MIIIWLYIRNCSYIIRNSSYIIIVDNNIKAEDKDYSIIVHFRLLLLFDDNNNIYFN